MDNCDITKVQWICPENRYVGADGGENRDARGPCNWRRDARRDSKALKLWVSLSRLANAAVADKDVLRRPTC